MVNKSIDLGTTNGDRVDVALKMQSRGYHQPHAQPDKLENCGGVVLPSRHFQFNLCLLFRKCSTLTLDFAFDESESKSDFVQGRSKQVAVKSANYR